MFVWKINIIAALNTAGYTYTKITKEHLIGNASYYIIKDGKVPGIKTLDTICRLLECQPGTLIKWVPDDTSAAATGSDLPEV